MGSGAEDFSPDGKSFTYSLNEDGRTATYLGDTATLQSRRLNMPEGITEPVGHPTGYSPDGHSLLITHQSSQRVNDIWVYDLQSGKPRQLTYSAIASLSPRDLPPSQLIHYKSFDGKIISAFLWVPYNLKRDGSNPAVVIPHGGPTGQTADSFNRTVAALASRGYVCIAPNVRGSTGYGIAFQKANFQDLGGGDLAGRSLCRAISRRHRLRRREEDRHHRRLLRRIHDPDGDRQNSRRLGRRSGAVRDHQLVHHARSTKTHSCRNMKSRCSAIP